MITNYHQAALDYIPDAEEPVQWGDPRTYGMHDDDLWALSAAQHRAVEARERALAELRASAPPTTYDWPDLPTNPAYDD